MNHLICFEEMKSTLEYIYNVDDYIFLEGEGWNVGPNCQIIGIHHDEVLGDDGKTKYDIGYQMFGYDKRDDVYKKFWVDEYNIERKLTTKEIEEFKFDVKNFELKQVANKYNI